jgi:tRNA splicing ligase
MTVLNEIRKLHRRGLANAGYRTIWRILKSANKVNATQYTVRRILKAIDLSGVSLRSNHRLLISTRDQKNIIIHIDGYDKFKPFCITKL